MKFLKNRRLLARLRAFVFVFIIIFSVFFVPFSSSAASSNITYIPLDTRDFSYLANNPSIIDANDSSNVVDANTMLYTVKFPDGVNAGEHTIYLPFKLSVMPNADQLFDFNANVQIGVDTNFYPDYLSVNHLYSELYYSAKNSTEWNFNVVKGSNCSLLNTGYYRVSKMSVSMSDVQLEADCFFLCLTVQIYVSHTDVVYIRVSDMSYSLSSSDPQYRDDYNDFSAQGSEVDSYKQAEDAILGDASDKFDLVKGSIFDTSLWNPDSVTALRGFITCARVFENFSEIPAINIILKYSLIFGILAFVLGLVVLFMRRR